MHDIEYNYDYRLSICLSAYIIISFVNISLSLSNCVDDKARN